MIEIWKPIPGYEGRYEASNQGRVRSLPRRVRCVSKAGRGFQKPMPGVVLAPGRCRGYLIVNLSGSGTIGLHILIAKTFCPGEAPGKEVNHKDGNKHNCAESNLEWVTKKRNMDHAVDTGLNTQAIRVVDPLTGTVYPSIARAARESGEGFHTVRKYWSRA